MPVSFTDYLAAKFALDERSLNPEVRGAFLEALRGLAEIRCLDAGAGTGATLRRLLHHGLERPLSVTALDRDPSLLAVAQAENARRPPSSRPVEIRFVAQELKDHRPAHPYNVIVAHAFLDIVPLGPALRRFAGWLEPGGYLHATLNYDGGTVFTERYEDAAFESRLLDYYNQTMESRLVDGEATGGAWCGRRLLSLLPEFGFVVLAHGASDWDIAPSGGRYCDDDATCLAALLEMICAEGRRSPLFHPRELDRWHAERQSRVAQGTLAMRVHNTDVLAHHAPRGASGTAR